MVNDGGTVVMETPAQQHKVVGIVLRKHLSGKLFQVDLGVAFNYQHPLILVTISIVVNNAFLNYYLCFYYFFYAVAPCRVFFLTD